MGSGSSRGLEFRESRLHEVCLGVLGAFVKLSFEGPMLRSSWFRLFGGSGFVA